MKSESCRRDNKDTISFPVLIKIFRHSSAHEKWRWLWTQGRGIKDITSGGGKKKGRTKHFPDCKLDSEIYNIE